MVSHTPSVLGKKGMNSVADLQRAPRRGGGGGTRRCRSVNGVAASPVSQPCRCAEQQRARVFDFQLWSPEQVIQKQKYQKYPHFPALSEGIFGISTASV